MNEESYLSHKTFLFLMIPFILSNITQPLLGAADISVVGRLNDPKYISGISIGTLIFNSIYWIFGFIRVSSTAFSAQSIKYNSKKEISFVFFRPVLIALLISLIIIIFHNLIFNTIIKFIKPTSDILEVTKIYFKILIWGAPFVLTNYSILGWLMGQKNIKGALTMQISSNLLNIILDIIFVMILKYKTEGVAYATLISQVTSTFLGIYFILPYNYHKFFNIKRIINKYEIKKILCVNRDLMIRTIFLLCHDNLFIAGGSSLGTNILSSNAILFQITEFMAYSFEGIANAASVFSGKAIGIKDNNLMKNTCKKTLQWGIIFAILLGFIYLLFNQKIIYIFTTIPEILLISQKYSIWIIIYPFVAFIGLTFYGVFTGAAVTFPIMTSTFLAFIGFFISWKFLIPIYQNNGLWISLLVFYFLRSVLLIPNLNKLLNNKNN